VLDGVVSHVPFEQHPLHDVPPQLHAPLLHACPEAHIPQALPPDPHAVGPWFAMVTHVAPLQQPPGHDAGVQVHLPVVVSQAWLAAHPAHATPAAPHFVINSSL
jgi:hypothetical protein